MKMSGEVMILLYSPGKWKFMKHYGKESKMHYMTCVNLKFHNCC